MALAVAPEIEAPPHVPPPDNIFKLPEFIEESLDPTRRGVFERIYDELVYTKVPMRYRSPEAVAKVAARLHAQRADVVWRRALRVTSKTWEEETSISPIRAGRPLMQSVKGTDELGNKIKTPIDRLREAYPPEDCDFCNLNESTPEDPFGNVEGEFSTTRANGGPYAGLNSMVIPTGVHDPLALTEAVVTDMVHTANAWFQEAHEWSLKDHGGKLANAARFPIIFWNTLPRGGSSKFHPHMQVVLAERRPYQETENARKRMADYQYLNHFPFLDDLAFALGRPLDLVRDIGSAHTIFHLTPRKEKEVVLYANDGSKLPNGDLSRAMFEIIRWWREELKVTSFNGVIYLPPVTFISNAEADLWHNFFPYARMVDRGAEGALTSDIGSAELYGPSIVSSDPFKLVRSFDEYINSRRGHLRVVA